MDENRFEGAAKDVGGEMQGACGDTVGSDRRPAEGRIREAEDSAQDRYGRGVDAARAATAEARRYAADLDTDAGG